MKLNMDYMVEKIWEYLALIRIYTKKPGNAPDLGRHLLICSYVLQNNGQFRCQQIKSVVHNRGYAHSVLLSYRHFE